MSEKKLLIASRSHEMVNLEDDAKGPLPQSKEEVTLKYITTAVIYYCNITYGISALFLAPIVVEFQDAYNTDMATLSWVFTISRAVMLVAFSMYGVIFNHVSRHALIVFLLLTTGLMMWAMPYSTTIVAFGVINVIRLATYAGWATAQAVWVIEIWKDAAGPYIQGQHFCFALGSMLPSIIFAPFLKKSPGTSSLLKIGGSGVTSLDNPIQHNVTVALKEEPSPLAALYIPTAICASLVILGAVFQLVLFLALHTPKSKSKNRRFKAAMEDFGSSPETKSTRRRKISLIVLASTLVGVCQTMETIVFQFLPAYVMYSNPDLSEFDAAQIMSAHTTAFTLARLVGIFVVLKLRSQTLLVINILFVVAANTVFTLANGPNAFGMLMGGSVLLGIGFSTIIPCVYDYVKVHVEITNGVASIFMVVGGALTAIFPILVGLFLEGTPAVVVYLNFGSVIIIGGTLCGIVLL